MELSFYDLPAELVSPIAAVADHLHEADAENLAPDFSTGVVFGQLVGAIATYVEKMEKKSQRPPRRMRHHIHGRRRIDEGAKK